MALEQFSLNGVQKDTRRFGHDLHLIPSIKLKNKLLGHTSGLFVKATLVIFNIKHMKNKDYSRRNFLKQNTLIGAGVVLMGGLGNYACGSVNQGLVNPDKGVKGNNGDMDLKQLQQRYHADLFDSFLPNMDKFVIDHELGGFMCSVDIVTGKQASSGKTAWYEGRGMWTYSFLYNNLEKNPKYLEVARKSKDFILKHQPADNKFWTASFNRQGVAQSGPGDIYSSLFVAEGLAEYAKASGELQYRDLAKKIILSCLATYDSPGYEYHVEYLSPSAPRVQAPRILGHWMVFLRAATQMLENGPDKEMETLADRCVDAILNYHINPEFSLINELLNHDMSRANNEFKNFSYLGHGIETLWMVLFEAARRKDKALFDRTAEIFKRHVIVAHDDVYRGYFRALDDVNKNTWKVDKVLWLQEEVLIGTLFIAEHTGDAWAKKCFEETFSYVHEKFDIPGYKFWASAGDRNLKKLSMVRAEHYHHPRHLMLNLMALNRMIERKGKVSPLFS